MTHNLNLCITFPFRGSTKEYKHYAENHPYYEDQPPKPDYLINKVSKL